MPRNTKSCGAVFRGGGGGGRGGLPPPDVFDLFQNTDKSTRIKRGCLTVLKNNQEVHMKVTVSVGYGYRN